MLWLCSGNIPKLLLALESMVFDVLFMVQHYVLYTNRADPVAKLNERDGGEAAAGGDRYEQLHSPINVKAEHDDEKTSDDASNERGSQR